MRYLYKIFELAYESPGSTCLFLICFALVIPSIKIGCRNKD